MDSVDGRSALQNDLDPIESAFAARRARRKWRETDTTADGEPRAVVPLGREGQKGAETIWVNTGTLCNIACASCYIESSPRNDRLLYVTRKEIASALSDAEKRGWPIREIGFTGGEPFLNPEIVGLIEEALKRGYEALVLTNAMKPMLRPKLAADLLKMQTKYGDKLTLRISVDSYFAARHDEDRGTGAFAEALDGARWLAENGFNIAVAGRTRWDEGEAKTRKGFSRLFSQHGLPVDASDPKQLVLFPEMSTNDDPPEISKGCWKTLGKSPESVMCASSRMLVKRKGSEKVSWLSCTLMPYDPAFELGHTAEAAEKPVALKHPYCASFCVLGGGSCSAG